MTSHSVSEESPATLTSSHWSHSNGTHKQTISWSVRGADFFCLVVVATMTLTDEPDEPDEESSDLDQELLNAMSGDGREDICDEDENPDDEEESSEEGEEDDDNRSCCKILCRRTLLAPVVRLGTC